MAVLHDPIHGDNPEDDGAHAHVCDLCGEEIANDGRCAEGCKRTAEGDVGYADDVLEAITPQLRAYDFARKTYDARSRHHHDEKAWKKMEEKALSLAEALIERADIRRSA